MRTVAIAGFLFERAAMLLGLTIIAVGCSKASANAASDAGEAAAAPSMVSGPAASASSASAADPCAPIAEFWMKLDEADQVKALASVDAACRERVLNSMCETLYSCQGSAANAVAASQSDDEKAKLATMRVVSLEKHEAAVSSLHTQTKAMWARARVVGATERSPVPACMSRMRTDFATINALKDRYQAASVGAALDGSTALNLMLACVDCASESCPKSDVEYSLHAVDESLKELHADVKQARSAQSAAAKASSSRSSQAR